MLSFNLPLSNIYPLKTFWYEMLYFSFKYKTNSYPFIIVHIKFPLFLLISKVFYPTHNLQTKNFIPIKSKRNNLSWWTISSTTINIPSSYSEKSSKIKIVTKIRLFSNYLSWMIVSENLTAYLRFTVTFLHSFCQT